MARLRRCTSWAAPAAVALVLILMGWEHDAVSLEIGPEQAGTEGPLPWLGSLSPWEVLEQCDRLERSRRRSDRLEALLASVTACQRVKGSVAVALLAGRVSLAEAANVYRELDRRQQGPRWRTVDALRSRYPEATDEEIYCRNVINHALNLLGHGSAEAGAVAYRLEAELAEHLARGRAVYRDRCTGAGDAPDALP